MRGPLRRVFAFVALALMVCVPCRAANPATLAGGESRRSPEAVLSAGRALRDRSAPLREKASALAALHEIAEREDSAIANRLLGEAYQARPAPANPS